MAMAAMKVYSAQGVLGVRNRIEGVSDPENGRFPWKGPFLGEKESPKLGAGRVSKAHKRGLCFSGWSALELNPFLAGLLLNYV